jgi:hypothetical protein
MSCTRPRSGKSSSVSSAAVGADCQTWCKRTDLARVVAVDSYIEQDTRERRSKPRQLARGISILPLWRINQTVQAGVSILNSDKSRVVWTDVYEGAAHTTRTVVVAFGDRERPLPTYLFRKLSGTPPKFTLLII